MPANPLTPSAFADKLFSVQDAIAEKRDVLQATIATGDILTFIADRDYLINQLFIQVAVCGTAGQTDIDLHVDGVSVLTADEVIANDDADGTEVTIRAADLDGTGAVVNAGSKVEVVVAAAPTAGTGLYVQVKLDPVL